MTDMIHTVRGMTITRTDALLGLRALPGKSIDLAIADPPYGASTKSPSLVPGSHGLPGFGGAWKAAHHDWDFTELDEHIDFTLQWLSELKRVVRPEGSIWIHSTYHNSGIVNVACRMLGLEIINEVAWFKRNSFPNLRGSRLTASHETILWVHTGGSNRRYRFNYENVKANSYPEDQIKYAGKQMRTVWDIPNNKKKEEISLGKHPTQKPERLIQRMLDVSAPDEGVLLSPFLGSGTDLVVAMRNGLSGVGFETSAEYFELAHDRLKREAHGMDVRSGQPPSSMLLKSA